MLKRVVSLTVCTAVMLCAFAGVLGVSADTAVTYSGPYVQVGDVTLPLAEHMPGTFFTKNGQACTNHATADCVASGSDCNCMRFYPTGDASTCEIDLLAVQCFGFSRLVFYKCFGFIDHSINSSRYHSVGYILNGWVTEESVKTLLMQAAPGAHVRLARGHSVSILTMDEDSITVYHGNSGGDNVDTAACVVSTKRFTWAAFAEYASAGIEYVNMPNEYPGWESTTNPETTEPGTYKTTDYLNLRSEPNTNCTVYTVIPVDTSIEITEINGEWGKTSYDGYEGWVYMYYTAKTAIPYITTDYVNFREEPNTDCGIYLTISIDTVVNVKEIDGDWGRISYMGYEGWICLLYAKPYSADDTTTDDTTTDDTTPDDTTPDDTVPETPENCLTPSDDVFKLGSDGYLRATAWEMTYEDFASHFEGQEIALISPDGKDLSQGGYVTTDTTVQLIVDGEVADEATVSLAGDLNRDGKVKAVDYLVLKRNCLGLADVSDAALDAGDVNADGKLSAADYLSVKRYCLVYDPIVFGNFTSKSST